LREGRDIYKEREGKLQYLDCIEKYSLPHEMVPVKILPKQTMALPKD